MSNTSRSEFSAELSQALEKKVLRKFDNRILHLVGGVVFVAFMDSANMGTITLPGLASDLRLHGNQYNSAVTVFFIASIFFVLPLSLSLKKFKPNLRIGFITIILGLVMVLTGLARTLGHLIAARLALGTFTGGILPIIVSYLSDIYMPHELQRRTAKVWLQAFFGGATAGFLAIYVVKMEGIGKLAGWRWIFILEGIFTFAVGLLALFLLPSDVASARFLSEEEKEYVVWRLNDVKDIECATDVAPVIEITNNKEKAECRTTEIERANPRKDKGIGKAFKWREIMRGILDVQTWLTGLTLAGLNIIIYSFTFFFPLILAGFKFLGIGALFLGFPPYILASILTTIVGIQSDRRKLRGPFVLMLMPLVMLGYILAIAGKTNAAPYVGFCFIAAGANAAVPCLLTLLANNTRGHQKRAGALAVQVGINTTSAFFQNLLYSPGESPRYVTSHIICLVVAIPICILVAGNMFYCVRKNETRKCSQEVNIEMHISLPNASLTPTRVVDNPLDFEFVL